MTLDLPPQPETTPCVQFFCKGGEHETVAARHFNSTLSTGAGANPAGTSRPSIVSGANEGMTYISAVFAVGLAVGFAVGYAVRAAISLRHRRAAMKRRYLL